MSRILAREYCFKIIFEYQFLLKKDEEFIAEVLEDEKLTEKDKEYIDYTSKGILEHREEIDNLIKQYLKGYTFERLFKIDVAILRIAVFELKYSKNETPENIVIDSAVELAKKYSTDNSYKFINGVLASIVGRKDDSKATN